MVIELAVVGAVLGALAMSFLIIPMPAWMPATLLWGVTVGFIVYRLVAQSRRRESRRPSERPATWANQDVAHQRWSAPPESQPAAEPAGALEAEDYRDTVAVDTVPVDADARRSDDEYDSLLQGNELDDGEVAEEDDGDDLRATLFDVPNVGATGEAFGRMAVFTEEEIANAQSETVMLETVDPYDDPADAQTLALETVDPDEDEAMAPTLALDTVDTDENDVIAPGQVRERAPTLDEDTWRRLREDAGGST
jgi:hypothetical protein